MKYSEIFARLVLFVFFAVTVLLAIEAFWVEERLLKALFFLLISATFVLYQFDIVPFLQSVRDKETSRKRLKFAKAHFFIGLIAVSSIGADILMYSA